MKRILRNAGGETVDEIVVADCSFHMEQLDDNVYWIGVTDKAGNGIAVNFVAGATWEDDVVTPFLTCTVEADGPGWTWDEDRTHEA